MSPEHPKLEASQKDRFLRIDTTEKEDLLLLEKLVGTEELSRLFEFKLSLLSNDFSLNMKNLLRKPATITMTLPNGKLRYLHGHFRSIAHAKEGDDLLTEREQMGVSHPAKDLVVYEAVLVPSAWFMTLNADCRIFQEKSVPDIVEQILKDHKITDYAFRTKGTYQPRDYCVQYRESSFDFISRLLEEEGIFYYFEHTKTKHTMVFVDKSSLQPPCPEQEKAQYSSGSDSFVSFDKMGITNLERVETAHTGKAALTDYNFETPNNSLMASLSQANEEVYDYPGEYGTKAEGERYTRIRLEELEVRQFTLNGWSNCRAFRPGYKFDLTDHYRKDTNATYFLTSVKHEASDMTYRQEDSDESFSYTNTFTAIPKDIPFRPKRVTTQPQVKGLQPAVVVGKAGEEIWVDKYGRVKVQFFWDRVGKKNEKSSCWVRVSQIWAGKNWGWMTIPRIGQEVLVDFLEGDPDMPIIVGRVYNADQMPPYTLPANSTQSGIKSRSSKGGSDKNFNEIRFEDKMGSEMFTVHAEKDMETHVENDDTQLVEHNRKIDVKGTHTETIVGDTSITITTGKHATKVEKGNQTIDVDMGNQTTTLGMGNQSTTIKLGNQTTSVKLGKIDTDAMQSITLKVGASSIKIDQMGVTISGMMIKIDGKMTTDVSAGIMVTVKGAFVMIN